MKLLLILVLVCAMAIAKPMDETEKPEKSSTTLKTKNEKNETALNNNHRVQRDDQMSSEAGVKEPKTYLNLEDDKSR